MTVIGDPRSRPTPDDDEIAAAWVARLDRGPLTAAEQQALDRWLGADDAHAAAFDAVRSLYEGSELQVALRSCPTRVAPPRRRQARMPSAAAVDRRRAWSIGAVLAATVATALLIVQVQPDRSTTLLDTKPGVVKQATLADGSSVVLNGGTSLRAAFDGDHRQLRLERGEAFFAVAHDVGRPFVVDAGSAAFVAVGTRFDVDRSPARTVLSVYEGRVRINAPGQVFDGRIFGVGAQVTLRKGAASRLVSRPVGDRPDWPGGWLEGQDIGVAELIDAVNRRSGSHLAVPPAVAAQKVTGRFRIDQPDQIINTLRLLYAQDLGPEHS